MLFPETEDDKNEAVSPSIENQESASVSVVQEQPEGEHGRD
jgi:hypothetical protein